MKIKKAFKQGISIGISILIIVVVGIGTYFFDYAIVRKQSNIENFVAKIQETSKEWINPDLIENLSIKSEDGLQLNGYYFPAANSSKKLAVVIHGHRDGALRVLKYARLFYNDGFNVFVADNRAHDSSEGKYIGFGWLERLDYLQWLNVLTNKIGQDVQIVLHGVSMGAATVMMLSGEETLPGQVKAIIEDCGYTSVEEEFTYQAKTFYHLPAFPILNIADLESKIFAGYGFKEASAINRVKKSDTPIFFIHGDADTYVPTFMVYKLYDAAPCEKALWIVEGAKHTKAYDTNPKVYEEKLKSFYVKYLQ